MIINTRSRNPRMRRRPAPGFAALGDVEAAPAPARIESMSDVKLGFPPARLYSCGLNLRSPRSACVSWPPDRPPANLTCHFAMFQRNYSVHDHMFNSDRRMMRVLKCGHIVNGCRIENSNVGEV